MRNLRAKGLTEGITITSKYEDQVQALENQARAPERTSEDIKGAVGQLQESASRDGES